jgi:hypothetical protein
MSGRHLEQFVDQLSLSSDIRTAHPPRLPIPNYVHRLITLHRAMRHLELSVPLLAPNPAFRRSVVVYQDTVLILHRSVLASAVKSRFLVFVRDG